ncbi:MAG TPA: hypothetical protein PKC43_08405 [Phycisphaerales bacterium]|nr:hypothetical protein [Phycisphaerales bacterium]HMP37457.1 hypothetical protein [Phycisphaerales bacterium]
MRTFFSALGPKSSPDRTHGLRRRVAGAALAALGFVAVGLLGTVPLDRPASAAPVAAARAAPALEVVLSNGVVWRGEIGDQVEISVLENGVLQTYVGELRAVERLFVKLETSVAGIKGTKVVVRSDMRSMTAVDGGAAAGSGSSSSPGSGSGTAAAPTGSAARPGTAPAAGGQSGESGTFQGVFFLPMEGTLGIGMRNEELVAIFEEADKHGPGQIIVLLIDSPGGLVIEGDKIHETFKKWKHKHRVVSWIRKAISGGAFVALHCDEIYFMSVGSLGAITMFDATGSIKGERLQAWLDMCSKVAEMGGRNPIPVRSMIDFNKITSYDVDERTGNVTWFDTMQGQYVLSSGTENLTFNARNALHSRFSDGTADTEAELAALLGLPEWREVNDRGRRLHRNWQDTIKRCKEEVPRLMIRAQDQGDASERGLSVRVSVIRDLIAWWDRAFNVMAYDLGVAPKEYLERLLRDTQKQLADLREQQRQQRSTR